MTVYLIASLTKTDEDGYDDYIRTAKESLVPYPQSRVVADDAPRLIEGTLPGQRVVMLRFKDEAEFDEWYNSDSYQEAIPHRLKASDTNFLMLVKAHS